MSTRRNFMSQSAAAASALAFPLVAGAQPKTVKIGVLHPVTGALAYSGQQCREGALMAIEDINKAGGIKSLGGAKIEALLGDAQSTPQAGTAEIEKMNEAGVAAVVGAFASAICLATTQAAAKYNLPHVVDVGVADQIVERGLKNTFRFGPGYKVAYGYDLVGDAYDAAGSGGSSSPKRRRACLLAAACAALCAAAIAVPGALGLLWAAAPALVARIKRFAPSTDIVASGAVAGAGTVGKAS